jgi:hypothetical protein
MAAKSFPCHVAAEYEAHTEVHEFPVSTVAGEKAAKAGELMFYDTADQRLERCGADPALILGIFEAGDSDVARQLTPDNLVPLRCLKPGALVRMGSAVEPAQSHIGNSYGIVRDADGNWLVDTTDAVNTRVIVKKIDVDSGSFFVSFIAANLQFDAIAS